MYVCSSSFRDVNISLALLSIFYASTSLSSVSCTLSKVIASALPVLLSLLALGSAIVLASCPFFCPLESALACPSFLSRTLRSLHLFRLCGRSSLGDEDFLWVLWIQVTLHVNFYCCLDSLKCTNATQHEVVQMQPGKS